MTGPKSALRSLVVVSSVLLSIAVIPGAVRADGDDEPEPIEAPEPSASVPELPPLPAPKKRVVVCVALPPSKIPSTLVTFEGHAVPPGYRLERSPNLAYLRGGLAIFGLSAGIGSYIAGATEVGHAGSTRKWLAVLLPVFGPFIAIDPGNPPVGNFALAAWGTIEAIGLGTALYGLIDEQLRLRPVESVRTREIRIAPIAAARTVGLSLSGAF